MKKARSAKARPHYLDVDYTVANKEQEISRCPYAIVHQGIVIPCRVCPICKPGK